MPRRTFLLFLALFLALAGAQPAAAATRYVDDTGANAGDCTNQAAPCLTLQYAVTQASAGDAVQLAAGTYAAGAVIDKAGLTITGAGTGQTQIGTTAGVPRAFDLRGAADGVTIAHLRLAGPYTGTGGITDRSGVHVGNTAGLEVAGLTLTDLVMTGFKYAVDVRYPGAATGWTLDGVDTRINEYGARFTGPTTQLHITGSHFDYANFGLYVGQTGTTPRTPGVFRHVEIEDSTFDGTASKGIYVEQAADVDIHDVSVVTPPGPAPRADVNPDNAVDVNVKYGPFANVRIADSAIAGSTSAAMLVHGRNDAPSYNTIPGSLDGVVLEGLTVTGNAGGGIVVSNAVTGTTLTRSRIVGNGGAGVVGWTDPGAGATVAATGNWWGCNEGPAADGTTACTTAVGDVDAAPWLVLSAAAAPPAIPTDGATSTITAALTTDSDGAASPPPPDGPAVAFATSRGSLSAASAALAGGSAGTVLTSGAGGGIATVTATLDGAADAVDVELVEPPANLAPPEITGSAVAGADLACSLGEWSGAGLLLAQRWTRDGADLPGATGPVHRTGVADAGHAIGCVVTATNAVGVAVEAAAAPVAVVPPPVRPQPHASSTGAAAVPQQVQVALVADDRITLLDAAGDPATEVEVADAGRYRLETAGTTATITFTPLPGFSGAAPPIAFQVTDVHGRSVLGSFAPTVLPEPPAEPGPSAEPDPPARALRPSPAPPTAPRPAAPAAVPAHAAAQLRVRAPRRVVLATGAATVPVRCAPAPGSGLTRCAVTLVARAGGRRIVLARGTASAAAPRAALRVAARLTAAGRARAQRIGGTRARVIARGRTLDGPAVARARVRLLPAGVTLRAPVLFAGYSSAVRPAERSRLARLRARLAGVRAIACTGYTNGSAATAFNARLAQARADHVCALLGRPGIATRAGTGDDGALPVAGARNRRTEIRLIYAR